MKQREVQDKDGMRWTCVQALGGGSAALADAAAERLEAPDGTMPVVCTPSGGAETVRVQLPVGWDDATTDEALLEAIRNAQPH